MEQLLPSSDGKPSVGAYLSYRIEDRSYLGIIKKDIAREAQEAGFSSGKIGTLDIILSELSSNLLKFGERGREILWKPISRAGVRGLEILALDKGPGIRNLNLALQDGYSSAGTAGEGLGALQRLADEFDMYSQAGQGTVVLCRLFAGSLPARPEQAGFDTATLLLAKPGQALAGDGYACLWDSKKKLLNLLVLDGLGHGPDAFKASQKALEAYRMHPDKSPAAALAFIHESIRKTRGVVGMALQIDLKRHKLEYCGIGNISGKIIGPQTHKSLLSFNGIIGHIISSRIHDNSVPWEAPDLLILHSDGLNSRWDLSKYPRITQHDPAILAACLYRDHSRGTDDVTVMVNKLRTSHENPAKAHY